ncbi:hypothetical protein WJX77_002419 [Trebouxia sp. C0004]
MARAWTKAEVKSVEDQFLAFGPNRSKDIWRKHGLSELRSFEEVKELEQALTSLIYRAGHIHKAKRAESEVKEQLPSCTRRALLLDSTTSHLWTERRLFMRQLDERSALPALLKAADASEPAAVSRFGSLVMFIKMKDFPDCCPWWSHTDNDTLLGEYHKHGTHAAVCTSLCRRLVDCQEMNRRAMASLDKASRAAGDADADAGNDNSSTSNGSSDDEDSDGDEDADGDGHACCQPQEDQAEGSRQPPLSPPTPKGHRQQDAEQQQTA